MSIFSSPQKKIEQAAEKVARLRAELTEAETEHREMRATDIAERLRKAGGKDDAIRPQGVGGPSYSASGLAGQCTIATDTDLDRFEAWLDSHEKSAREQPKQHGPFFWGGGRVH